MNGATCSTCAHCLGRDADKGWCHRNAPRPQMSLPADLDTRAFWPSVDPKVDGCGEHAPDAPVTFDGLPALRAAMAPFLRAASALVAANQAEDDDLILLDVVDDDSVPIGISTAEIVALAVAFEQLES